MKVKVERLLISVFAFAILTVWKSVNLISSLEEEERSTEVVSPSLHVSNHGNHSIIADSTTKPYFILHIGVPKTATTYIQCNLHKLSKRLADDDSYFFVGKTCPKSSSEMENGEKTIPGHFLMMGLNDANTKNRGYEKLKARMDFHRVKGNNIIYSNEAFTNHLIDQNKTWDSLKTMFTGWNVRVVIGYRHYFDWIRSFYYQTHKQNAKLDKVWPNQGGKLHPSFISFLDYHLQRKESGDLSVDGGIKNNAFGHHLTISAYKKFSPHFDDIKFISIYDKDMLTDFVCRILPNADKTCHSLRTAVDREEETHSVAKRASQSFDAHRISEAALDKGYISKDSDKKKVVEQVKKRIEKIGTKPLSEFLACPPPSLVTRLLNASIDFENEMLEFSGEKLSASAKDEAKSAHISMYRKSEAENRFCDLDPELILKDSAWVSFLSKIGKKTG